MTETGDELPDDVHERVTALSEQGNERLDASDPEGAVAVWEAALALLPEPQALWQASVWLNASIGDARRAQGRIEEALERFDRAFHCDDGAANPFVVFSLGACLFELGRRDEAIEPLLRAYMLEGEEIFEDDPDYLDFLRSRVRL